MRSSATLILIGVLFILFTDSILFLQIKNYLHKKAYRILYGMHSLLFVIGLITYYRVVPHLHGPVAYYWLGTLIGCLFLFYTPKVIFIIFNGLTYLLGFLSLNIRIIGRRVATIVALLLFLLILYSITWGRYNYKMTTTRIDFNNLPVAFNNLKIIQIADLHLGSYSTHYKGIPKLVEMVNEQEPDIILFTGDMVNNFASEMNPWIKELSQLKAKYGKFAVTGNHDYGNYTNWENLETKKQNKTDFFNHMAEMGFIMLNNASQPIIANGDTIYIAGVENWGNPPFPRYGDLSLALENTKDHFVILLSHDPSHWRAQVLDHPIPLTLSGHTHAMQMGIEIGNFKWSPAQYLYPEYDGLYNEGDQYLHVSRGQGYLGFPGRIGLRPEISEIILIKK